MRFSSMLLYVDNAFPTMKTFERLIEIGNAQFHSGNYLYKIQKEIIQSRYFWIYFTYDNEKLYADTVIDTEDNSEKTNPRPKTQVEMRNQLFVCYDMEKHLLYVSDYSKKAAVTNYISDTLQVHAYTKNILRSVDDFLSVVKSLKSVTFVQSRSLITSAEGSIFSKTINIFGLDLPERSKIRLDYGSTPISSIRNAIQKWKLHKDGGEFDDITIVGTDDAGFESSFNFSTMVSSIEISAERDDDYRFDPQIVRVLLINRLGG